MSQIAPRFDQIAARRCRGRRRERAFTLIEAALTTVIVGVGVLAMVESQQAYHRKNEWARRSGLGMLLANELRELTLSLPLHDPLTGEDNYGPEIDELAVGDYDDVDDFAGSVDGVTLLGPGTTFSPPINALAVEMTDMDSWSQEITVANVLASDMGSDPQPFGTTPLVRLTVSVRYLPTGASSAITVAQLSWVVD